jgi:hypothetical protein
MNSLRNHVMCYNLALHSTILMHPRDSNTCRTYELQIKYIRELYVESRWFRSNDRTAQVIRGRAVLVPEVAGRNSKSSQFTNHLRPTLKGKGKAIPLQAWTCPEGSRRLRLTDFKTIGT